MSEPLFQAALDADPSNAAVRLLLADHLAERGDERAAGYRWMASTSREPWEIDGGWRWYRSPGPVNAISSLPADMFELLPTTERVRRMARVSYYISFPTRRDAENALAMAVAASCEEAAV